MKWLVPNQCKTIYSSNVVITKALLALINMLAQCSDLPLHAIIGPVQIMMAPPDMTVNASQTVSFACVATGLPPPHITWLRDGTPIKNSSLHVIQERREQRAEVGTVVVGTLEICPVIGGVYSCLAQNEYTSRNISFTVAIPGKQADMPQIRFMKMFFPQWLTIHMFLSFKTPLLIKIIQSRVTSLGILCHLLRGL